VLVVIILVLVPNDSLLRESSFMGVQILCLFFHLWKHGHCKVDGLVKIVDLLCFHGHYLVVDLLNRLWDVSLIHGFRGANGAQH
jgi:hypothetical protein